MISGESDKIPASSLRIAALHLRIAPLLLNKDIDLIKSVISKELVSGQFFGTALKSGR